MNCNHAHVQRITTIRYQLEDKHICYSFLLLFVVWFIKFLSPASGGNHCTPLTPFAMTPSCAMSCSRNALVLVSHVTNAFIQTKHWLTWTKCAYLSNKFTTLTFPSPHSTHQHIAFRLWRKLHPSQFGTAFFSHFQWYLISIQIVANLESFNLVQQDSFLFGFSFNISFFDCSWVLAAGWECWSIDVLLLTVKLASLIGMVHFDSLICVLAPSLFCYLNGVSRTTRIFKFYVIPKICVTYAKQFISSANACILPFCETRRETDSSASRVSSVCAAPLMYKVPRRQSCRKWCCFPRKMLVRSWLELRRWLSNLPCAFGIVFSSFQVLCDFSEYIWLSRMSEQLMKFRIVCEISLLAVDYALRRTEDGHCIFTFNPV